MQSYYKRFIRDYMRYKDEIQCAGAELVAAVHADALREHQANNHSLPGEYYALHIRRGDMAHKIVKLPADQIVRNLRYPDGSPIIPPGAFVYISTDDPKGICEGCTVQRKSCDLYPSPKPEGCPEDVSVCVCQPACHSLTIIKSPRLLFIDLLECLLSVWLENSLSG